MQKENDQNMECKFKCSHTKDKESIISHCPNALQNCRLGEDCRFSHSKQIVREHFSKCVAFRSGTTFGKFRNKCRNSFSVVCDCDTCVFAIHSFRTMHTMDDHLQFVMHSTVNMYDKRITCFMNQLHPSPRHTNPSSHTRSLPNDGLS